MTNQTKKSDHLTRLADPAALNEGEFGRSRLTRIRILDAGVAVLAEVGYKKLSTTAVAERAGLTRAAMLYHFKSRSELIDAIIRYVTRRRVDMYEETMKQIPHDELFLEKAVDIAWQQLQTPEFAAFTELSLASRTDEELKGWMEPAMAAFDRARREAAIALFPKALSDRVEFDLRRDITRFLLEGIAQQDGITFNRQERTEGLLRFAKMLLNTPEGIALLHRVVAVTAEDDAA